jgi:hypothetical protein
LGSNHCAALNAALIGVVALVFSAPTADAFVRTEAASGGYLHWAKPERIRLVVAKPPTSTGVSHAELVSAVRAAADTWNAVDCSRANFLVERAETESPEAKPGSVTVSLWTGEACPGRCPAAAESGLTTLVFDEKMKQLAAVAIQSGAVRLNARDNAWDGSMRGRPADLQVVLTHELGHVLGLAETCVLPGQRRLRDHTGQLVPLCHRVTKKARAVVMFPGGLPSDLARRTLDKDDKRGSCALYPKR